MTVMPDTAPLATTAWLAAHLGQADIVVLDATTPEQAVAEIARRYRGFVDVFERGHAKG